MSKLKGIDAILMIGAQLILEGIHCENSLGNEVRVRQASILIQACSDLSNKDIVELMITCKTMAVTIDKDFSKHERIIDADDILNKQLL